MAENLNIGFIIQESNSTAENNGIIEKFCYEDNSINCNEYGGLYNWDEMMQYDDLEGTQGICPSGWHLPTDEEWKTLEGTVDSQYGIGDTEWNGILFRGFDAGQNLKTANNWNGTNLFGFTALPAGGFDSTFGGWSGMGISSVYWTSTSSGGGAFYRGLDQSVPKVVRFNSAKTSLMSVRCVKNGQVF
jgi:uncharacterized protein (TIGR02145 family)